MVHYTIAVKEMEKRREVKRRRDPSLWRDRAGEGPGAGAGGGGRHGGHAQRKSAHARWPARSARGRDRARGAVYTRCVNVCPGSVAESGHLRFCLSRLQKVTF